MIDALRRWPTSGRLVPAATMIIAAVLAGCSAPAPNQPPSQHPSTNTRTQPLNPMPTTTKLSPAPPASPTSTTATPAPSVTLAPEPTTTNTLPPPPPPTSAAPSTAGDLNADALPRPAGWRTIARPGGLEEGYQGNGTWVHAKDPRYAARDLITIGCATVTRDDYTDPRAALEGTYTNAGGAPGVGLVLEFATSAQAKAFFDLYRDQVRACTDPDGPVLAKIVNSSLGLIDQRSYPGDDEWTEVAAASGRRAVFVILTDPGHRIDRASAEAILRQLH